MSGLKNELVSGEKELKLMLDMESALIKFLAKTDYDPVHVSISTLSNIDNLIKFRIDITIKTKD